MNLTLALVGLPLAVMIGAGVAALLIQVRPQWSAKRRTLVAAAVLPCITAFATLLALLWIASLDDLGGGDMRDLASATIATGGLASTLLAFLGGLVGASLAQHRAPR